MGVAEKLLVLFVAFIALQGTDARPHFSFWKWKNLEYEINKASDDAERDVRKDLLNVKNNLWKDTNKLVMKVGANNAIALCIIKTQEESLGKFDEISGEAVECIQDIRSEASSVDDENLSPKDFNIMKNDFKNKIKTCRNESKYELKASQKEFALNVRACLDSKMVPQEQDFSDSEYIPRSL